jgi:hypothetical protein
MTAPTFLSMTLYGPAHHTPIVLRDALRFPAGESYGDDGTRCFPEKRPFSVNGVFSDQGERWRWHRDDGNSMFPEKRPFSVNGVFSDQGERAMATAPRTFPRRETKVPEGLADFWCRSKS